MEERQHTLNLLTAITTGMVVEQVRLTVVNSPVNGCPVRFRTDGGLSGPMVDATLEQGEHVTILSVRVPRHILILGIHHG